MGNGIKNLDISIIGMWVLGLLLVLAVVAGAYTDFKKTSSAQYKKVFNTVYSKCVAIEHTSNHQCLNLANVSAHGVI